MGAGWCLFHVLLVLPAVARSWDVIVASEGQLNSLTAAGEVNEIRTAAPLGSMVSLALSPKHDKLYLGDSSHPNASVLSLDLISGEMQPVVPKQSSDIHGLALDPINNFLYWTTGYGHSIVKMDLHGQSDFKKRVVKIVHKFREEIPQGIAVDSCGRFLFWTNSNQKAPSIERSKLDGSSRLVIVNKELYVPLGVAVDQTERKLYWSQELEGVYYSIERSDLDGSNREIMRAMNHQPFSLTVGTDFIFWADWIHHAVWKKDKNDLSQGAEPIKVHTLSTDPTAVVAFVQGEANTDAECKSVISAYELKKFEATTIITTAATEDITEADWNDETSTDGFCLNDGSVLRTRDRGPVCRCLPGFTGVRCEIEICFNYCIHGHCSMDKRGGAECTCEAGFSGPRCEHDLCSEYCLNGGHCSIINGTPSCECHEPFKGKRCEMSSSVNKLCELYCQSELAVVPLHSGAENGLMQPLCVCAHSKKNEYQIEAVNGSAFVVPGGVSPLILTQNSSSFNETTPALAIALGCISLILLAAVILLGYKVVVLRKRPRIKKRFIGSKTVTPTPLTNRPNPAIDQCEINIENCCNMNICETPCFEPNLRTSRPGSKREEKKTLLDSMENSQGGSHDDLY